MVEFDDLLEANRHYAETFGWQGFDGIARQGLAMVTCMDSRIVPLEMVGLSIGDAKILRTPGGHLTQDALRGLILGVHLLGVTKIMIVPHTRCAMAVDNDEKLHEMIKEKTQVCTEISFGATSNQLGRLIADVRQLQTHPMIEDRAEVAGFLYDVDSGLLQRCVN